MTRKGIFPFAEHLVQVVRESSSDEKDDKRNDVRYRAEIA